MRKIWLGFVAILLVACAVSNGNIEEKLSDYNGTYVNEKKNEIISTKDEIIITDDKYTFNYYVLNEETNSYELRQTMNGRMKKVSNTTYFLEKEYYDSYFRNQFIRFDDGVLYEFDIADYVYETFPDKLGCDLDVTCDDDYIPTPEELDSFDYKKDKYRCSKIIDVSNTITSDEIEYSYDQNNLLIDELSSVIYVSDYIYPEIENEDILKQIAVSIVTKTMQIDTYHEYDYETEKYEYKANLAFDQNRNFDYVLVSYYCTNSFGFFMVKYEERQDDSPYYAIYYDTKNEGVPRNATNGDDVRIYFSEGDSTACTTYTFENDHLYQKE